MTMDDGDRTRRLVLIGMMGAGKTAVGRAVADRLGRAFLDNDALVREIGGAPSPEVAADRGVAALHAIERAAAERVIEHPGPFVACVAASIVEDPVVVARLRGRAVVAWLRARPDTLRLRIADGAGRRDDARSIAWLEETAHRRAAWFAAATDLVIDVDGLTVEEVAARLVAATIPGPADPPGAPGGTEGPSDRPR